MPAGHIAAIMNCHSTESYCGFFMLDVDTFTFVTFSVSIPFRGFSQNRPLIDFILTNHLVEFRVHIFQAAIYITFGLLSYPICFMPSTIGVCIKADPMPI